MSKAFHEKIRNALADSDLQSALDANAENRLRARVTAYASLPENWHRMRQRAHAVRASTINDLDTYLERFIAQAESNGIIVHRAEDAAHAVKFVMEIAEENRVNLIAKSKTMVSEEIGLNHALESEGLRVIETDLGEYIIQLRGEPPAHIITPAVHLKREQVAETFHDHLGVPLTNDIAVMTSVARRELRQVFLSADMGVSGVNFGVAETGTMCLVTNEGNGRMVTTIPNIHVALMGIERLVPTMDDLALMLALLPRSATGQKITVYVNLIHSPRKPGDPDGPRERHLILVDNGRTALRNSPLSEALLCIRCGACLNACPVFREIGGHAYVNPRGVPSTYPGPIGSVISPALFGQSEYGELARASSLCGACKEACPVDIDLPKLLLRVRAGGIDSKPDREAQQIPGSLQIGLRLYSWLATNPKRFAFSQRFAGFVGRVISPGSAWLRMPGFTGWGNSKDIPKPAQTPFRDWWTDVHPTESEANRQVSLNRESKDEPEQASSMEAGAVESLVDQFARELTALDGSFGLIQSSGDPRSQFQRLCEGLLALLKDKNCSSVLCWQQEHLPAGLLEYLEDNGIRVSYHVDPTITVGLTGTIAAVADTGTIVLPSGPGRLQAASLLPGVHVAVLKESDIFQSMEQVLQLDEVRAAASVSFISGPSRTADIEMTLTLGVHGPREVHVFCLAGKGEVI